MDPDGSNATPPSTTPSVGGWVTDWQPLRPSYKFVGFLPPVDNADASGALAFNTTKAGAAVPWKFSLGGDKGLDILASDTTQTFPLSFSVNCDSGTRQDDVEQTVSASAAGPTYNASNDTYTYVWKTDQRWAGTCRQFVLKLNDGSYHRAKFEFRYPTTTPRVAGGPDGREDLLVGEGGRQRVPDHPTNVG
jgi:hypothetical protein